MSVVAVSRKVAPIILAGVAAAIAVGVQTARAIDRAIESIGRTQAR